MLDRERADHAGEDRRREWLYEIVGAVCSQPAAKETTRCGTRENQRVGRQVSRAKEHGESVGADAGREHKLPCRRAR